MPTTGPKDKALSVPDMKQLVERAERMLLQLEAWLPPAPSAIDWSAYAFRWRKRGAQCWLDAVRHVAAITADDLRHVDRQKAIIDRNTVQFLNVRPADNVLMTGARGTGKSLLVKAMLAAYGKRGLRVIEVNKGDLPDIVALVGSRSERFIVFCDDLSFEEGEAGYKALKSVLEGSVLASGDNVLIYAISNRRHLMPEYMSENLQAQYQPNGEIHSGEMVEEKISLSERFGIWVSFYPFKQDDYLAIIHHWLRALGCSQEEVDACRLPTLQLALERGSRLGGAV